MADSKKPSITPPSADDAKKAAGDLAKHAEAVFGKMKKHFEPAKVDAWQKRWLEVPDNRKKYAKLADAPEVVGEELTALANDIIDFAQGEETGKSHLFAKLRGAVGKVAGRTKKGMEEAKKRAEKKKK